MSPKTLCKFIQLRVHSIISVPAFALAQSLASKRPSAVSVPRALRAPVGSVPSAPCRADVFCSRPAPASTTVQASHALGYLSTRGRLFATAAERSADPYPNPISRKPAGPRQQLDTAMSSRPPLRIGILNCPGSANFDPMYRRWMGEVADRTGQQILWKTFEAAEGQLPELGRRASPSSAEPPRGEAGSEAGAGHGAAFDGFIISGSRHGVYEAEQLGWIAALCEWAKQAHQLHYKLLGVCFGHQVVARALGGSVVVNPAGFEIGRYSFQVSAPARQYFEQLGMGHPEVDGKTAPGGKGWELDMMYVHGDYVPENALPPGVHSMGGTALSPHNGMFNCSNVLTFQGHPEFLPETVELCMDNLAEREILPARLPPHTAMDQVREGLTQSVDATWLGHLALKFFQDAPGNNE